MRDHLLFACPFVGLHRLGSRSVFLCMHSCVPLASRYITRCLNSQDLGPLSPSYVNSRGSPPKEVCSQYVLPDLTNVEAQALRHTPLGSLRWPMIGPGSQLRIAPLIASKGNECVFAAPVLSSVPASNPKLILAWGIDAMGRLAP